MLKQSLQKQNINQVRKPTKTISGIAPVSVMLPPRSCNHGICLYCPSLGVPQSYTPKSPGVMRAIRVKYDPYKQVADRINAFKKMNHPTDKIELILMGGTFLEYPEKFRDKFVLECYNALNEKVSKSLRHAQKLNEHSKNRCVALCIETRPDSCSDKNIKKMREYGATRVELGVQILDDKIYKRINRGHKVKDVIEATQRLRDAGFKIGYHIMPGLPGSNSKKDLKLFRKLFSDERFKPDQLKLYPCQVIPGSGLEKLYWAGKYKPYTKEQIEEVLIRMMKEIPGYCRVMRMMREIPPEYIVAGTIRIDLRKDIEKELRKKDNKIKEIRYREIGFAMRDGRKINLNLRLKISKYNAAEGKEFFLEVVNKDHVLFGLLRLRILGKSKKAIIRELHVYGQSLNLGERPSDNLKKEQQHQGLGKQLIKEAEKIVKENKIKKLSIISGVGVREYYRNLGYKLEDTYMVKKL